MEGMNNRQETVEDAEHWNEGTSKKSRITGAGIGEYRRKDRRKYIRARKKPGVYDKRKDDEQILSHFEVLVQ